MNHEKKESYKSLYIKAKNILLLLFILYFTIIALSGCTEKNDNVLSNQTLPVSATVDSLLSITGSDSLFAAEDKEIGYDDSDSVIINLSDEKIFSNSDNVTVDGATATITSRGTYILNGTLNNGRIVVDTDSENDVRLVLNGVNIINNSTSSICVESAHKVYITLGENTENKLSNNFHFTQEENADGVIYSNSDITINGRGSLEISSSEGSGIVSEKNVIITGGTIDITSDEYGIYAFESVRISSAMLSIDSNDKGIYSSNEENDSLGFVYISDGIFEINSNGSAVEAKSIILIDGGAFNINSVSEDFENNYENSYGLTAGKEVSVHSGEFVMNTAGDAVHSEESIAINGGNFNISSNNMGFFAKSTVLIGEAEINIEKSYIGVEGYTVFIKDCSMNINSEDDGINAAGGNDNSGLRNEYSDVKSASGIRILSGYISINAFGDGMDSLGDIYVSDGLVLLSTPDNNESAVIDYSNRLNLTGGTILGTGNIPDEKDFSQVKQTVITLNVENQPQDSFIEILDESGNIVLSDSAAQSFNNIFLSSSQLQKGHSYTLKIGNYTTSITP